MFIAYAGAPSIFVGIFGIASALFFVALVGVLLTRAARRGADQQVAPTAAPIPRTGYSPDGAWWWDGTQWHAVPTEHVPAAAAP